MNYAKKFLKSSIVYFIGNVLTKVISIFLLRIYTSRLSTTDMGYYDITNSYLNVIVPMVCLEIWSAIMRFMFDYSKKEEKYKSIFNGLIIFGGSLCLYTVAFCLFSIYGNIPYLGYIFVMGLLMMLQNIYTFVARGLGYSSLFAVSGIISSLVNAFSNIIMILFFHMGLSSLYLAMIFGLIVQIVMLESRVQLFRHLSFSLFDKSLLKRMFLFSLPLSVNTVCFWFLSSYNRIGITNSLGLSANGIYSVAGKFTQALFLVSTCFSMAWQELVFAKSNDKDKSVLYTRASNYYILFLFLGLAAFLPLIKLFFSVFVVKDFVAAYDLIPLYMLATVVSIYSDFLGNIYGAEKRTGVIFLSTLVGAAVNVAVLYLLIGYLGIQAANVALLCGFITNVAMRIILLKSSAAIRLNYKAIFALSMLFLLSWYLYSKQGKLVNIIFLVVLIFTVLFAFRGWVKEGIAVIKRRFGRSH